LYLHNEAPGNQNRDLRHRRPDLSGFAASDFSDSLPSVPEAKANIKNQKAKMQRNTSGGNPSNFGFLRENPARR
jgi:hypothetical protein